VRLEVIEERDYVEKLGSGIRVDEPDEATENPKRIKFIKKRVLVQNRDHFGGRGNHPGRVSYGFKKGRLSTM